MKNDKAERLTKVYWADIRQQVANVNKTFSQLVDELSPGKDLPIYLAKYAYGDLIGDTEQFFFPNPQGSGVVGADDDRLPTEIKKDFYRSARTMPFGMVLNKKIEYFIDFPEKRIKAPSSILSAGQLFPLGRILNHGCKRRYHVNSVICAMAGAKSAFMLPSIGRIDLHVNLQNDYRIKTSAAKSMYDHWQTFKEIADSEYANCDWSANLLLFTDIWEDKLHADSAWHQLRSYLYQRGWESAGYRRNQGYCDIAISAIQEKRNLKPNPYLTDTARYLLGVAVGALLSYRPAIDEESLPLHLLQTAFVNSYGLKHYIPIIMEPASFYFEQDQPIYYSLQNPSTHNFSPKSRRIVNALFELRELANITEIFVNELGNKGLMCSESIFGQLKEKVIFSFYHNQHDRHGIIAPSNSEEIMMLDHNIQLNQKKFPHRELSTDAKFLHGCVAIRQNKTT